MSWLAQHLNEFVNPILGYIPHRNRIFVSSYFPKYFTPEEMTRIKNAWKSVKRNAVAQDKTLLLLGRDVWVFEVLARRENFPTRFIPQCSRLAVSQIYIDEIDKYLILDTGFMGSIPQTLGSSNFSLLSHNGRTNQIFPNMKGSRSLALKIESAPKYWKTGFIREGFVGQDLSDLATFHKAAVFTQEIYTDSSPKEIPNDRPTREKDP